MKISALCYSYYHVAQTLALCDYLIASGVHPELTIFRGKFLGAFRVNPDTLALTSLPYPTLMEDMPRFHASTAPWAVTKFLIRSLRTAPKKTALVNPNGPHFGFLSAITASGNSPDIFFSIEDGLGTYGGVLHRAKAKARESSRLSLLPLFLGVEVLKTLLLKFVTFRSGGIIRITSARSKHDGRTIIELAPYIKSVLANGIFGCEGEPLAEDTVLFLSQPYVEIGVIDVDRYLACIKATEAHFSALGKSLLIKAHPAEDLTKWRGHNVCNFDGPVEVLLAENQSKIFAVVGTNSTALILAKRLFELRTFRIQHPALSPLKRRRMNSKLEFLLEQHTERLDLG